MGKTTKIPDPGNRSDIKKDIKENYLSGKCTLKSILEKYNIKQVIANRIMDEIIYEMRNNKI